MLALGGSITRRLAVVGTALWLSVAGPALAGDGGADLGIQAVVNTVCTDVGMTSCPKVPTITQAILEISGLENAAPDFVRGPQGNLVVAGFQALCSVSLGTVCSQANAIN